MNVGVRKHKSSYFLHDLPLFDQIFKQKDIVLETEETLNDLKKRKVMLVRWVVPIAHFWAFFMAVVELLDLSD